MKSLYQMLLAIGYPEDQMDHHEPDLYIFQTPLTNSVINQWCKVNGLRRDVFVTQFQDQITGRMMFEVAFAYDPWWTERSAQYEKQKKQHDPDPKGGHVECPQGVAH